MRVRFEPLRWNAARAALASVLVLSCGDDEESKTDAGRVDRLPAPLHPSASCPVVIDTPELLPSPHVAEGTPITYNSNPPTSGPHFAMWANYQEFTTPVPRGYLVHSLEHGGVLLLYRCADAASCPDVAAGLRKVRDAVPTDSRCDAATRARVVIAPDPGLDVPVAAAAWGWFYKADCVDLPTLQSFAKDRYARGPEDTCAPGQTAF